MRAVKHGDGVGLVRRLRIVGVLACVGAGAPASDVVSAAPPAPVVPNVIAFWDARQGLLGTGTCRGAIHNACREGTVQLTSNGGRSFRLVLRTRRPVIGLSTAGPHSAIAKTDGGGSFRTLDGGRSWKAFRTRYGASFATSRIGLGFRSYMTHDHLALELLATKDGRTWRRRASPCSQAVASGAVIDLVTPVLGWIVCLGQPGAGNEDKAVFRTTDRGRSWRRGPRRSSTPAATSTAASRATATREEWRSRPTASESSGRAAALCTSLATVARIGSPSRRSPGLRSTSGAVPRPSRTAAASCSSGAAAAFPHDSSRRTTPVTPGGSSTAGAEPTPEGPVHPRDLHVSICADGAFIVPPSGSFKFAAPFDAPPLNLADAAGPLTRARMESLIQIDERA